MVGVVVECIVVGVVLLVVVCVALGVSVGVSCVVGEVGACLWRKTALSCLGMKSASLLPTSQLPSLLLLSLKTAATAKSHAGSILLLSVVWLLLSVVWLWCSLL